MIQISSSVGAIVIVMGEDIIYTLYLKNVNINLWNLEIIVGLKTIIWDFEVLIVKNNDNVENLMFLLPKIRAAHPDAHN